MIKCSCTTGICLWIKKIPHLQNQAAEGENLLVETETVSTGECCYHAGALSSPSSCSLFMTFINTFPTLHAWNEKLFSWNNNWNGNFHVGRDLPFAVSVESYWFAAVPFQPTPVPVFIGLPGGSSSQALYLRGKAARTKCLGNTGLLQSHKHTAVCSRAAVRAPQPARPPASLMCSWWKGPGLLWITKQNRRAKLLRVVSWKQ